MADMRLWTPVANAYDAYRRRLIADPSSMYEHLWRLIHIHESLVVTLGAAFASRLLAIWKDDPNLLTEANRLRCKLTGLASPTDPNADTDLSQGKACLDGYIKPWIDMVKDFSSREIVHATPFCTEIAEYANHRPEQPVAFFEPWKKISEVPQEFSGALSRIDRYHAINSLRNKLAHVPVPHKLLQELHWGLRQEILALMTSEYKSSSDSVTNDFETTKWYPVMRGRLHFGNRFVNGSAFGLLPVAEQGNSGDSLLLWQAGNDAQNAEKWKAAPFFRIDDETKVSLLFLLNDIRNDPTSEDFKGEYHRFAAELMPVEKVRVSNKVVSDWIPVAAPKPSEPSVVPVATDSSHVQDPATATVEKARQEENLDNRSPSELRSVAEGAFRIRDYQRAVTAFQLLADAGDAARYNDVARSKHGAALWRFAESNIAAAEERIKLLNDAISLLDSAIQHRDPDYRARAFYEKSKAIWHKWKNEHSEEDLRAASECASQAATLQYEPAYVSWYEKIQDDIEKNYPENGKDTAGRGSDADRSSSG
jgi:hypothetical protein